MSSEHKDTDNDVAHVNHGRDLTTGSIPKHLVKFSLPILLGNMLQVIYGAVNAFWVGRGLGTNELAAVGNSFSVVFAVIPVGIGLTMASNILASQAYGARDWDQLKRVVQNAIVLVTIASIACAVGGQLTARLILDRVMHVSPQVLPLAVTYLHMFLWTLIPVFGVFGIASLLRGVGDSTTPVIFQAVSIVLNAILDPILMFGWLGAPTMGLYGTALASIIASSSSLIGLLIYLRAKRHIVRPDWAQLRVDWHTTWLTLKIGVPSIIQQVAVSLGSLFIMKFVNVFGSDSAAAYTAVGNIDALAFTVSMSFGIAVSSLSGQNIGARKYDRVKEVFRWGVLMSCALALLTTLMAVTIPSTLLAAFTKNHDVVSIGVQYLRIVGFGYIFLAILFASNGVINGSGHTFVTTIISLVGLWVIRLPLAYSLSMNIHRVTGTWSFSAVPNHIQGIWWGLLISFGAAAVMSVAYYLSGKWRSPVVKHALLPDATEPADGSQCLGVMENTTLMEEHCD